MSERNWGYAEPEFEKTRWGWSMTVGMVSLVPGTPPPPLSATQWFWTRHGALRAYRRLVEGRARVFYGFGA